MPAAERDVRWTVFLDRDGTINRKAPEGDYIRSPDRLVLLDGVADAISRLRASGALVVVVTNQRGVARGLMTLDDLAEVHRRLAAMLDDAGTEVDALYSCPHEAGSCDCRKPEPGLFLRAATDHPAIDFGASAMVGDSASDVEAGARLGMATVLLADPAPPPGKAGRSPDHVAPSLAAAADWLLLHAPGRASVPSRNP
jgi:D-glycero-D-manno-heptose 1,7-bisphosphate phosphatase